MGLANSSFKSESLECLVKDSDSIVRTPAGFCIQKLREAHEPSRALVNGNRSVRLCNAALLDKHLHINCRGQLELQTQDLIFRTSDRSLTWPLWCLRWYGENAKFFVFESGRRCPSGPGLYMFKCKQSRQLSSSLDRQIALIASQYRCSLPDTRYPSSLHRPVGSTTKLTEVESNSGVESPSTCSSVRVRSRGSCPPSPADFRSATLRIDIEDYLTFAPPNQALESTSTISYPLLLASPPVTLPQGNVSDHLNYLDIVGTSDALLLSSSFESAAGQYLIAAAPHPYVNQPNRMLSSQLSEFERVENDYVPEPAQSTEAVSTLLEPDAGNE
ncbi:unnamed protein product [Calicophoron daubneyi]|uniref:IRS-type PTB domain-containing protein n=1 Tax=Calicophoron daubneyi TaxID=300641 RepID=A0AAV2TTM3_CALDB